MKHANGAEKATRKPHIVSVTRYLRLYGQ